MAYIYIEKSIVSLEIVPFENGINKKINILVRIQTIENLIGSCRNPLTKYLAILRREIGIKFGMLYLHIYGKQCRTCEVHHVSHRKWKERKMTTFSSVFCCLPCWKFSFLQKKKRFFPYGVPMVNIVFSAYPVRLSIHFAILLHDQIMVLVFITIHDYVQSIKLTILTYRWKCDIFCFQRTITGNTTWTCSFWLLHVGEWLEHIHRFNF